MFDIAIIGGGVNGCGIARDAAGRGHSVLLLEKSDLASGTSSASTKLIHGGLRYLEHFEFFLVREALKEREILLKIAPHIAWPMRFILPHHKGLRPWWLLRVGLFLYDHLGGRKQLPPTSALDLRKDAAGQPLQRQFSKAFEYSDCWVDDARLVVLNAMSARALGADIRTRSEVTGAQRIDDHWQIEIQATETGTSATETARTLINAAGPWVSDIVSLRLGIDTKSTTRLVRGSHLVVKKLFDHDKAYIFQNEDNRVIFAIPYETDFTLIGTTDVPVEDPETGAVTSPKEIEYLCEAASEYFSQPITPDQVVHTYGGIRPLYDDGESTASEVSRDYVLELLGERYEAPLLNIFGGKITTYRLLAEDALGRLKNYLPQQGPDWTARQSLPGGEFDIKELREIAADLRGEFGFLEPRLLNRLLRTYGLAARAFLSNAKDAVDLGIHFGAGLYQCEVEYLLTNEFAMNAEDILWRRTKLGVHLEQEQQTALQQWIANRPTPMKTG